MSVTPLGLLLDPPPRPPGEPSADGGTATPGHPWWHYATEVLDHLRLPYVRIDGLDVDRADVLDTLDDVGVLVLAGPALLPTPVANRIADWVRGGGALIAVGGPGDPDASGAVADLFGVRAGAAIDHEHVRFHPGPVWTQLPDLALHAIGGHELAPDAGDGVGGVEVLASWKHGTPAITIARPGDGLAICCGVDLWQSIVRIQQGYRVVADGAPAADGTAPIDDGILKCEDGFALDFEADRAMPPGEPPLDEDYTHTYPPPSAVPMFHRPIADLWRSVFLQCVWWAADQGGVAVPWLHYWTSGVPAIAHLSHDSDLNTDEDGEAALSTFDEAGVEVTWCQVFPGGYAPKLYAEISAAGHEQALHFNAMGDADIAQWGWRQIRAQYAWAQAVTGTDDIVSNKNHYTRWEGWTEFYRWCERLGIQIDQSRGPSKQGTVGFPFGTAHVSFPIHIPGTDQGPDSGSDPEADAESELRYLDVLNLPLHTQDLAWAGHESIRDVILDQAVEQHGVGHFLFHGRHLNVRPEARAACLALVAEVRRRGMEWWTSRRIDQWERLRRRVRLAVRPTSTAGHEGHEVWEVVSTADEAVSDAQLLLLLPGCAEPSARPRLVDGAGAVELVHRHGRAFVGLSTDIPAGGASWTLSL